MLGDLASRATGWVSSDSSLFTWWLGWTSYALGHGLDPLTSTAQNAPDGVNGLWNTGVPVLGVLLAPVTATAGPVVADDLAMILGPAVSAYAAHRALAVLVGPRWIRALAGLVYGFSPFVIAHAWVGHVNLVWSVLPPVVLWASVRVLAGQGCVHRHDRDGKPARPWRDGALLGLAFSVQVGLYTQTVALGAVALVVVAVVLAVSAPRTAWRRLPALARSLAAAAVVVAVLCAWPAWVLLRGPGRPRGPIRDAATMGADAANLVVPSPLTAIRPGTDALAAALRAYPGEQGSYLGVAMLAVFLAAVVLVRSRAVVLTAVVTVLLGVASLGTSVAVLGHDTGIPLPWRALVDLPLVGQAEAGRLAPFVALGVVAVWAIALEHLTRPGARTGTGRLRRIGRAVAVAAVLAAAVTWVPVDDQLTTAADAPPFFTARAPDLGPAAPDGGPPIVEMVPRPSQVWQGGGDPLRWQALAGFSFRQTGGYFIGGSPTTPVLYAGEVGAFQRGVADGGRGDVAAARADLAARQVSAIVVVPASVPDPDAALRWARAVGGGAGRSTGGVWIVPVCPAGRCPA